MRMRCNFESTTASKFDTILVRPLHIQRKVQLLFTISQQLAQNPSLAAITRANSCMASFRITSGSSTVKWKSKSISIPFNCSRISFGAPNRINGSAGLKTKPMPKPASGSVVPSEKGYLTVNSFGRITSPKSALILLPARIRSRISSLRRSSAPTSAGIRGCMANPGNLSSLAGNSIVNSTSKCNSCIIEHFERCFEAKCFAGSKIQL